MDDLTDFDREGFFEVFSLGVFTHVNNTYGPFLDVFYRLNKLAWSLQYEMSIPKPGNDIRRAWCAVLYARTLNFVQAAVMLATKGMRVQADTQHRCALETLFKLGALTNDDQFIIDYKYSEQLDIIKHLNSLLDLLNRQRPKPVEVIKEKQAILNQLKADIVESLREHRPEYLQENTRLKFIETELSNHPELKQKVLSQLKKAKTDLFDTPEKRAFSKISVTTRDYASKAKRLDMYDLHYRMGSAAVHSDSKSLEDGHFELNEDGTVKEFKNEPHLEDLHEVITSYCILIFDAIRFIGQALEYDVPEDELRSIEEALEGCHKDAGSVPK